MPTHRVVLVCESVLVLFPVTVLAFAGGFYLLLIMLGQELFSAPVKAIWISATTMIGLLGLVGLWVLMVQALGQSPWPGEKSANRFFLLAHPGAGLAILGLVSLGATTAFPSMGEWHFAHLNLYAIGAPALLPYAHLVYLKRNNHVEGHRKAPE